MPVLIVLILRLKVRRMVFSRKAKVIATLFAMASVTSMAFTNCADQGFQTLSSDGGDPLLDYAWHLNNTGQKVFASAAGVAGMDLNLQKTWAAGIYGNGVKIQVSDMGVEDTHEDLQDNFAYDGTSLDFTKPYPYTSNTAPPETSTDFHGTPVAGLIAAVGWNGKGARGVAPKAKLVSSNVISGGVVISYANLITSAAGDFDISNMSWGSTQNMVDVDTGTGSHALYESTLYSQVVAGRDYKGKIYVKAAGNDYAVACYPEQNTYDCVGNSNFDRDNTNPYQIVVSALNASGKATTYSSSGANLWIASFGGMFGSDTPAMLTTDRTGCDVGQAESTAQTYVAFDKGTNNSDCKYTATFNGTSSAAPTVSGVVALLLEANPNLTWRDVKYILAKTARQTDFPATIYSHPMGKSLPSGMIWEQGWITNGAGFKFQNRYGFGTVDTDAAVALAQSYSSSLGTYVETAWTTHSGLTQSIPGYTTTGTSNSICISSSTVSKIEAVNVQFAITHSAINSLQIELTSPSNTKSIIINAYNSLTNQANFSNGQVFLSNAFFQESPTANGGCWTLKVMDAGSSPADGVLNSWSIKFAGGQ